MVFLHWRNRTSVGLDFIQELALDQQYLKRCLGSCLAQALAEVVRRRPSDPIEFLAYWLYDYRRKINEKEEKMIEKLHLEEEKNQNEMELQIAEQLKAEEIEFEMKHKEFQRKTSIETFPTPRSHGMSEKIGSWTLPTLEELDEPLLVLSKENITMQKEWIPEEHTDSDAQQDNTKHDKAEHDKTEHDNTTTDTTNLF
ncbi:DPY30 domain-containing protein 2 isoform X2 [Monodelphis domestica]|uniref:DPY30 domain-containing protein 2 isoform X2 n=1 Tax=Monodelphis domestica TaxID=13616 RepID=UPI0024E1F045|nr:DPY30 domain-containing protein 2 isoform X2 [Monodelphis domestica]